MKTKFILAFIVSLVFMGSVVYAANPGGTTDVTSKAVSSTIQNPLKGVTEIPVFIANALTFVAKIGAVFCVFFLIYAGFLYVKARGNPSLLTKAHEALKTTIYGIILLLGAQLIASIIEGTINALKK